MEELSTIIKISLTSDELENGDQMPQRFTCDGENINPALHVGNLPPQTVSMVLLLEDPDAPTGTWTHWLLWNIPPQETIEENTSEGVLGKNDFGSILYNGPCPALGVHRYFFRIYALDISLELAAGSTREELLKAMEFHIIGSGELMALYGQNT